MPVTLSGTEKRTKKAAQLSPAAQEKTTNEAARRYRGG
jgi:hypothetical protein